MKTSLKISLLTACLTIILFPVFAQVAPLPMPESDTVWSAPKIMTLKSRNGTTQTVQVKSKLVKHKGTTGFIEVEITNQGPKKLTGYVTLVVGDDNMDKVKDISYNNSTRISYLGNNYWIRYTLQLRECLPKGRKNMTDLQKCVACNPYIGFAEVWFD